MSTFEKGDISASLRTWANLAQREKEAKREILSIEPIEELSPPHATSSAVGALPVIRQPLVGYQACESTSTVLLIMMPI